MKKLACILIVAAILVGCSEDKPKEIFNKTLLYGKWVVMTEETEEAEATETTLFYVFHSNQTGETWDTSDGITQDDAQPFTWQIVSSELQLLHSIGGGSVPRNYTIKSLNAFELTMSDLFRNYTFIKID